MRTRERLRHHYEIEKRLAARLHDAATREERTAIFNTMYDELFREVPDHPRLTERDSPEARQRAVRWQMGILRPYLTRSTHYLEFAPGSCALAWEVARHVARATGVDISDQSGRKAGAPANFDLVVYDGYELALPDASIDVAYSNQLIEHLHPDDARAHFALVKRLLKPGGTYVLATPERWTGPHDISRYFSDVAEGFHLHEWDYPELLDALRAAGLRPSRAWWAARGVNVPLPIPVAAGLERILPRLPGSVRRRYGKFLVPMITLAATR